MRLSLNSTFALLASALMACACAGSPDAGDQPAGNANAGPDASRMLVQSGDDMALTADDAGSEDAAGDEMAEDSEGAEDAPAKAARPQSNVRFYKMLGDKGNASLGDGYRLAYNLWKLTANDPESAKQVRSFSEYRDLLRDGGLIDSHWSGGEEDLLTHEEAAYLFAKAIDLQGGVWWSVTGLARYGHREMVDRGLFPASVSGVQYISGPQLYSAFRDSKVFAEQRALKR